MSTLETVRKPHGVVVTIPAELCVRKGRICMGAAAMEIFVILAYLKILGLKDILR